VDRSSLLIDTGPLYAALDRRDAHHDACVRLITEEPGALIVPQTVIAEVSYFLGRGPGAEIETAFLGDLAQGTLLPEPVAPSDWLRIAELVWRYRSLPLGTVDASIVAIAERLGIDRIATLDHRHFEVVRPRHIDAFTLLP
jgi:predicted nucleic acid-binding protein